MSLQINQQEVLCDTLITADKNYNRKKEQKMTKNQLSNDCLPLMCIDLFPLSLNVRLCLVDKDVSLERERGSERGGGNDTKHGRVKKIQVEPAARAESPLFVKAARCMQLLLIDRI